MFWIISILYFGYLGGILAINGLDYMTWGYWAVVVPTVLFTIYLDERK